MLRNVKLLVAALVFILLCFLLSYWQRLIDGAWEAYLAIAITNNELVLISEVLLIYFRLESKLGLGLASSIDLKLIAILAILLSEAVLRGFLAGQSR